MNKKKLLASIAIWALAVALTCLIFFVVFDDYTWVRGLGLTFMLIAQTVVLGIVLTSDIVGRRSEKVMYNAGIYSSAGLYLLATLITSAVFMALDKGTKWMVLLDSAFLILFAAFFVLLLYMSNAAGSRNRETLKAISKVKSLETTFLALKNNAKNTPYSVKLNKLYEAAKYCDCTTFCETDETIQKEMYELEMLLAESGGKQDDKKPDPSVKANAIMDNILLLYKRRAEEVKNSKGGGF